MSSEQKLKDALERGLGYCPEPLPVSPLDEFNRIFTFLREERDNAKTTYGKDSHEYLKASNEYRMFALATEISHIKGPLLERIAAKESQNQKSKE